MAMYLCGGGLPLKTKSNGTWVAYPTSQTLEVQVDLGTTKKVKYIVYTAGGATPETYGITIYADGTSIYTEGASQVHYGVREVSLNARYIKLRGATSNWQTLGLTIFYEN